MHSTHVVVEVAETEAFTPPLRTEREPSLLIRMRKGFFHSRGLGPSNTKVTTCHESEGSEEGSPFFLSLYCRSMDGGLTSCAGMVRIITTRKDGTVGRGFDEQKAGCAQRSRLRKSLRSVILPVPKGEGSSLSSTAMRGFTRKGVNMMATDKERVGNGGVRLKGNEARVTNRQYLPKPRHQLLVCPPKT